MAGRTMKISQLSNNLPNVSDVVASWEMPITANYVIQSMVNGEVVDTPMKKFIKGIVQPLKAEEIALKEEGMRSFAWFLIHVHERFGELQTTQILTYNGVNYKIKAKKPYSLNGYFEYHAITDFDGE